jgi:hypothetical protein
VSLRQFDVAEKKYPTTPVMNLRKIAVAAFVSTTLLVVAQAGISEGNFVRQGKELGRMPPLRIFHLMPRLRIAD